MCEVKDKTKIQVSKETLVENLNIFYGTKKKTLAQCRFDILYQIYIYTHTQIYMNYIYYTHIKYIIHI